MSWMKFAGRIAIVAALGIVGLASMADPAQGAPKVTIKFAHVNAKTHPCGIGMEYFREKVEKMSNGEILVKVFHSAALGGDPDIIQGVQMGNIEMGTPTAGVVAPFCKEFDIMSLPFVFRDMPHIHKVLDGELGKVLAAALEKKTGIMTLGWSSGGIRQIETRRPVHKVADMKGLKIRTMNDPGIIEVFKLFGSIPTPIAFGEVYSALQSGVVDGCETSFISWINSKLYEVAKYGIRVNYMDTGRIFFINKKFFDKLAPQHKEIITTVSKEAIEIVRKEYIAQEAGSEEKAKQLGATIIHPDVESFKSAARPIYDKFTPTLGKEWIERAAKVN
jgi:tripartite ATP-independent transporter DctP family solute receptor